MANGLFWTWIHKNILLYRHGDFDQVIGSPLPVGVIQLDAEGAYILAITYHLAGDERIARAMLDEAHRLSETWTTPYYHVRLICETLRQEAEHRILRGEIPVADGWRKRGQDDNAGN